MRALIVDKEPNGRSALANVLDSQVPTYQALSPGPRFRSRMLISLDHR